ncbi:thermonuclease family protein [Gemella cuniculi]|uniref:thermonuclease family protein n=1 Tax=Gemella cuniculi TaxID=150240 RepID=UPI000422C60F|nr:thermonuclease family protein [Gemella cuniculi]
MNKKVFIICLGIFSIIFFSIFFIIKQDYTSNYKVVEINGVKIKGDTTKYKVNFVKKIDGDTIVVNFNKKDLKIRYLLVDTPETVKRGVKVQKYGPEASELNGKILSEAKDIEIEFDIYQKEDKYHRALCYVYADGKSVQEQLLLAGLAEIKYVKEPDTRYLKKFKNAQNKAKSNKRNLWSQSNNTYK